MHSSRLLPILLYTTLFPLLSSAHLVRLPAHKRGGLISDLTGILDKTAADLGVTAQVNVGAIGPAPITISVGLTINSPFNYVIVGGGTAGLALAARLSENPANSVLVLEAGPDSGSNIGVEIPGLSGSTFKSPIDWNFNTAPQANANGRSIYWPRGKVIAGSSALNFLAYTRGAKAEYNAWNNLGNKGWGWSSLLPYFLKSERFTPPTTASPNQTITYDSTAHGTSGPVNTSFPPYVSPQFTGFFDGLEALGIPAAQDLSNGSPIGVSWIPSTIDSFNESRATSETAYINPIAGRPNLLVVANAQVLNITWAASSLSGLAVATGVSYQTSDGSTATATALKEVILSAGSVQTPQLLELSGVGDPKILTPLGIPVIVNLPGVGNNLQDHPASVVVYKLKPGLESLDDLGRNASALDDALAAYEVGKGILTQVTYALAYLLPTHFLSTTDQATAITLMSSTRAAIAPAQLAQQITLYNTGAPVVELLSVNVYFGQTIGDGVSSYISLATCLQHSFSRGSIHITSSNPLVYPNIDPQYLQHPLDLFLLSKSAQFLRQVANSSTFASYLDVEVDPGPSVQTEAQWESWIKGDVRTEYHPIGTASMLPRASKGVVDSTLKVYGTSNVRVVDCSIIPLHVSAHLQSVAYAIAEKAADMILSA